MTTQFKSLTAPFPNGLTNAQLGGTMASAGTPDPTYSHMDCEDFNRYLSTDWTTTVVGAGTTALTAGNGGLLLLTTTTGATDSIFIQRPVAGFVLTALKQVFLKFAFTLSDATN